MTTVGVLGVGRMGGAMARALATAGHDLVLWNRSPEAATTLATELGGQAVASPAEVARAATVCVSMLADGPAVDAVYGGPAGLVAGAGPANVLVDASTVPPSTLRGHAATARAAGAGLLDAPVSGSVSLATAGKLTLMVGGEVADLERARPILDALATTIFHLGPLGTGAAMKLAVNTVIFGLNQAVAEGLVLAEAAGIERAAAYDVLAASAAGAPYVGYKRAAFVDPDGTPVAFSLDLAAKDLRLIEALARASGVDLPQARADLAFIEATSAAGGGDRDFSGVAEHLRTARQPKEGATA
jgi:3-hydroxyisobutyrate dehydrogenase-like beta-hydroxyacid dehydrogenase